MTIKEFFSLKKNSYFWANILAMMVVGIALLIAVFRWLDIYTHHGEAVSVPNVRSMTWKEAVRTLQSHDLVAVVADSTYIRNRTPGSVIDVRPAVGQNVKKGRTIYLTINTGNAPLISIPDVVDNSSYRQAEARMKAAGFKLAPTEMVSGEKDWVYGVKMNGKLLKTGDKIPQGSTLVLMVGNGTGGALKQDTMKTATPAETAPRVDDSWF